MTAFRLRFRAAAVTFLAIAILLLAPTGIAAQSGGTITYTQLNSGSVALDLYRFKFEPAGSIPGPYPEAMMLTVVSGTMVLYLGGGTRATLDPRGAGVSNVPTLEPVSKQNGTVTFVDTPPNQGQPFTCQPTCNLRGTQNGLQVGGNPAGNVGIKLTAGFTVFLPGPSSAFVCNTGDDNGKIEVVAVKTSSPFSWIAYASSGNATTTGTAGVRALPAQNPGGCAGRAD